VLAHPQHRRHALRRHNHLERKLHGRYAQGMARPHTRGRGGLRHGRYPRGHRWYGRRPRPAAGGVYRPGYVGPRPRPSGVYQPGYVAPRPVPGGVYQPGGACSCGPGGVVRPAPPPPPAPPSCGCCGRVMG
jgi:hypothetical protein